VGKSYRKNPIFKNTKVESDRSGKQIGNRKLRGATREILKNYDPESDEDLILPEPNEVYNVHHFDSDGKHYSKDSRPNWGGWNRGPDKRDFE